MIAQGVDVVTCHVDSPEGRDRDRRARRHLHLRLPLPTRRSSRPRAISPAPSGTGSKVYVDMVNAMKAGQAPGNFVRGGLKEGYVRTSAYGPAVSAAAQGQGRRGQGRDPERQPRDLQGPAQGQQGQHRHPVGHVLRRDRAQAREHELPGRGRDRRDVVERASDARLLSATGSERRRALPPWEQRLA